MIINTGRNNFNTTIAYIQIKRNGRKSHILCHIWKQGDTMNYNKSYSRENCKSLKIDLLPL